MPTTAPGASAAPAPTPALDPQAGRPSFRERVDALRNLPPFLREIWRTSRPLTIATMTLRLLRALLPVAMLYLGKLIIDEAIGLVGTGAIDGGIGEAWRSGVLDTLALLLAAEFGLAILSDLLGRLVAYCDQVLSEMLTNAASVRLMEHAATLDLAQFEDPTFYDHLERARRQTVGRIGLGALGLADLGDETG